MKKTAINFIGALCISFLLACFLLPIAKESVVCDAALVDILTPEIIEFYESEISKKQVVSDKSDEWIERTAQRYGISPQKVKAVLIVKDFCETTGEDRTFLELSKESDFALFEIVKARSDVFTSTLDDEQKQNLKQKASELLGIKLK